MKLFAVALYARKESLWSSGTSYVGAADIACYSEQQAKDIAMKKLHELRPESEGWGSYHVYLVEISRERALSVLSD